MPAGSTADLEHAPTAIEGLLLLTPKQIDDDRGTIRELYRRSTISTLGSMRGIRQVNLTHSHKGAIRGLHGELMNKLVGVAVGEAFGAYLDARTESETYGELVTVELTLGRLVLVPAGVCNGFQAVSDGGCLYFYCFDEEWGADMPSIKFHPLDPGVGVPWPIAIDPDDRSRLSAKDASLPFFSQQPPSP
jgi:dTDP-4-dehydrorhamnose 3,5-epimerase